MLGLWQEGSLSQELPQQEGWATRILAFPGTFGKLSGARRSAWLRDSPAMLQKCNATPQRSREGAGAPQHRLQGFPRDGASNKPSLQLAPPKLHTGGRKGQQRPLQHPMSASRGRMGQRAPYQPAKSQRASSSTAGVQQSSLHWLLC